jgi:hypothetical protein
VVVFRYRKIIEKMTDGGFMTELLVSIGFDVVAMVLTACYIAKLVVEGALTPSLSSSHAALHVSESSVAKRSLLSQAIVRRAR